MKINYLSCCCNTMKPKTSFLFVNFLKSHPRESTFTMLFYKTGFHYSLDYVFSKFIMCFCFTVLRFFFSRPMQLCCLLFFWITELLSCLLWKNLDCFVTKSNHSLRKVVKLWWHWWIGMSLVIVYSTLLSFWEYFPLGVLEYCYSIIPQKN